MLRQLLRVSFGVVSGLLDKASGVAASGAFGLSPLWEQREQVGIFSGGKQQRTQPGDRSSGLSGTLASPPSQQPLYV